jgi:DNA-binding NarL/FixJ family response regulator
MHRGKMPTRILIADDHGVMRAGLHALLGKEAELEVVGEAANGEEALRFATTLQPDLVLMDVSMPSIGGIDVTRRLKDLFPQIKVLILTVYEDKAMLQEAIRAGAAGYINKRVAESELLKAIHAVISGIIYIEPHLMRTLVLPDPLPSDNMSPTREELTAREIDVMRLIVQGHTNRQIAGLLNLSVRTVETHRANLLGKLNLHGRVELVRYATDHGLFDPDHNHRNNS